jgi:hypothetical protein
MPQPRDMERLHWTVIDQERKRFEKKMAARAEKQELKAAADALLLKNGQTPNGRVRKVWGKAVKAAGVEGIGCNYPKIPDQYVDTQEGLVPIVPSFQTKMVRIKKS